MVEVWLSAGNKRLRLPVLPEKITLEAGGQHEKVSLHEAGEVLLPGKRALKTLALSSYFPGRYTSLCAYRNIPDPKAAADLLREWAENGTVARLVIAGGALGVSMAVIIESFSSAMRKVQGDVEYDMALTEFRRLDVVKAKASTFKLHPRPLVLPAPPKPVNKRYPPPASKEPPEQGVSSLMRMYGVKVMMEE